MLLTVTIIQLMFLVMLVISKRHYVVVTEILKLSIQRILKKHKFHPYIRHTLEFELGIWLRLSQVRDL